MELDRVRHIQLTSWRGPMGTVSLVLVSHSRQLAEGVRELAAQMTQGKVQIAVAGGTADGRLGTDATAILGAIEAVRGPEGVLTVSLKKHWVGFSTIVVESKDRRQASFAVHINGQLVRSDIAAAVDAAKQSAALDSSTPASSAPSGERYEQLAKINELKRSGVLTEAEFEEEKARILKQP